MSNSAPFCINLGGEGEVPGVLNQQPPGVLSAGWFSSVTGETIQQLVARGLCFVIAPNVALPFPDESFDVVITNGVPLDRMGYLGPGVQSSEIRRILKLGGRWVRDRKLFWIKP